ncbi:MAG: molecular chaperone [Burkholderiales bacterium]|nr:molecular chaperone [Burkholderiales bacterium]
MRLVLALFAALLAIGDAALAAGSFSVSPVRVDLRAGQTGGSIEVINNGSTEIQLTVERFAWRAGASGDQLEPTADFVASPPLFDLRPGERQVVRILFVRPADPQRQLTYRIALQESPARLPVTGLATVLRVTLPVFVTPPRAVPSLQWRRVDSPDGPFLEVENRGDATALLAGIRLEGARDLEGGSGYVLPGQTRRWRAPELGRSIVVALPGGSTETVELQPPR